MKMSSAVYLGRPGVVSALGDGLTAMLTALWVGGEPKLTRTDAWLPQQSLPLGVVHTALRAFDEDMPVYFGGRNNQLLWQALAQIEPQIEAVKQRFGAERVAVVLGTSTGSADENQSAFQAVASGQAWFNSGFVQAQQVMACPAQFVQWQYGLQGLAYVVSTACTSGARAIISAARLLQTGQADAVVCGGVDCLSALTIHGFASLSVLSDQIATPFAPQRKGINIGEAAAVFVATRQCFHEDDVCLWGFGASSDAWHMSSPRPDGAGAEKAIRAALASAGVDASDLGWLNLHGTGTEHNDHMESQAVARCLGTHLPCTSTKPYTGHTLGAAGALEAAMVWGMVSRQDNPNGYLPAHYLPLGYDTALPAIALTKPQSVWSPGRRLGMSTSFAFGGNNCVLIMGEDKRC